MSNEKGPLVVLRNFKVYIHRGLYYPVMWRIMYNKPWDGSQLNKQYSSIFNGKYLSFFVLAQMSPHWLWDLMDQTRSSYLIRKIHHRWSILTSQESCKKPRGVADIASFEICLHMFTQSTYYTPPLKTIGWNPKIGWFFRSMEHSLSRGEWPQGRWVLVVAFLVSFQQVVHLSTRKSLV